MRKKRIIALLLIAAIVFTSVYTGYLYYKKSHPVSPWTGYEEISYHVYSQSYDVLIADTPAKQTKGLMDVRSADEFDGMLFRFPVAETQYFWNENTYMDLDIYWMRKGTVVGKSFLPSIEKKGQIIVNSPEPVDEVVEIIRK